MSNLWRDGSAADAVSVGIGSIGDAVAATRPAFRAFYGDRQDAAPRSLHPAQRPAPPVQEDPIEQARIDAFTMGFEEGCRVTQESIVADQDACARLADALEQLAPASAGTLSTVLSAAVIRLVSQIVGEVAIDEALLLERCQAVAAFIEDSDTRHALHVNAEDLPFIEAVQIGVPVVADPTLRRGSVRLDTADGWIEDGPDVRLSRLKAMLDDMEGRL
ncbi:FliH/SctL family protein [Sphingobium algorifonticola]|uniref:Flagellar biosynthesis protein n=1 Tax=Sphingobium algorifonticola TaxID=2008318 RepID=A0A437JBQ5_9SPHN|nr:FliH/SctL family protein [Sphingobium algorifonticola]RVT43337.1 flagellar biosynthesis protein [Sphingobium algorifonticola]